MTVNEIFTQLDSHMVEGLMFHAQLSDYFCFLGLTGYQICQLYHYYEENSNYRKLSDYCLKHCDKLITQQSIPNPRVIPESWYQYSRKDVNTSTRKNSIQTGYEKWIQWEADTKKLYEKLYQDLISLDEISIAEEVAKYIRDVDEEHAKAYQKHLELKAIDYNISDIINEQEQIEKKYRKKIKEIELC